MSFEGTIEAAPNGGAYIRIPADVVASLGGGGHIPVVATFDGIGYRGSIVRVGGQSLLGVTKGMRKSLGKSPGDVIEVSVELESGPRVVDVPVELSDLLQASPAAREAFDALSYSHRREHALYVAEAKKPETRERRARKTVETLTD